MSRDLASDTHAGAVDAGAPEGPVVAAAALDRTGRDAGAAGDYWRSRLLEAARELDAAVGLGAPLTRALMARLHDVLQQIERLGSSVERLPDEAPPDAARRDAILSRENRRGGSCGEPWSVVAGSLRSLWLAAQPADGTVIHLGRDTRRNREIADRIVASLNFCAGISTADLAGAGAPIGVPAEPIQAEISPKKVVAIEEARTAVDHGSRTVACPVCAAPAGIPCAYSPGLGDYSHFARFAKWRGLEVWNDDVTG